MLLDQTIVKIRISPIMLFEKLEKYADSISSGDIPDTRKAILTELKDQIVLKLQEEGMVNLNFICTHNSRRSHLAQVWAQFAAYYFTPEQKIHCYSGGTEATALYPAVAEVLSESGYHIDKLSDGKNPVYGIKYTANQPAVIGFSKQYHHSFNPSDAFVAVMTCSQADEGCPLVSGASARVALTYDDPKLFDETPEKMSKYRERSEQIAGEMFWLFNELNKQLSL